MIQVIAGGGTYGLVTSGTQYNALMGVTSYSTDTGVSRQLIPTGGTISKLLVKLSAAVAAGASWTFTLNVNEAASTLTCTINAGDTTGSDVSNSVAVSAGDRVFIQTTFTGSPGSPVAFWTTLWTPTTAGESICLFKIRTQYNATRYGGIQGPNGADLGTENYVQVPCPSSGGFKKLYCRYYHSGVGAGKGYVVTLRVDGSDSALAVTLLGPNASGNDTADTISCTAGQLLSISAVPSSTPETVDIACGMVWADDTDGNALVTGFYPLELAASNFLTLHETSNASSPEDDMQSLVQAYYIKHLYARLTSAPAAGSPCTFMLRLDKADSILTVTISNPATTSNYLTQSATLTDGMLAGMQIYYPPAGSRGSWGMVLSAVGGETYDLTCSDGLVVGEALDTSFEFRYSAEGISFGDTVTISLAKIIIVPPMLTYCDNPTMKMNCRDATLLTYCDNPTLKLNDPNAVLQTHSRDATLKTKSRSTVL